MRAQGLLVPFGIAIVLLVPVSGFAATVPPLPNCDSTNVNYQPTQTTHVFVVAGDFGATINSQFGGVGGATNAFDTSGCATGDGDNETGQGAAQFPEVSQGACDPAPPVSGHHNGGVGATATVQTNTANLPMDFTFGTDGQDPAAWLAAQTCTGNGIVSDSYDTDPFDCGQGVVGHFPGTSATLAANPNPHDNSVTDPDPWATFFGAVAQNTARADPNGVQCFGVLDGSAWAFTIFGPSVGGVPPLSDRLPDVWDPRPASDHPVTDSSGCPKPVGNGSSVGGGVEGTGWLTGPFDGNHECGIGSLPGDPPTVGVSTPIQGTITAP
ncbi:MAG: hypothetical protein QOE90_2585 [Thermoplasmata archaeon]|jgi:hypothetical protein|nr:hypothetical protein [Thermoplasmata archaeon]